MHKYGAFCPFWLIGLWTMLLKLISGWLRACHFAKAQAAARKSETPKISSGIPRAQHTWSRLHISDHLISAHKINNWQRTCSRPRRQISRWSSPAYWASLNLVCLHISCKGHHQLKLVYFGSIVPGPRTVRAMHGPGCGAGLDQQECGQFY